MKFALILTGLALLVLMGTERLTAAPTDHLAPVPTATAQEKEVISLLQTNQVSVSNNRIFVALYNPTKYELQSCVIRVVVPSSKIDRVYYSDKAAIPPFKDGVFQIDANLDGRKTDEVKVEIIGVSWAEKK
jgi:hypothetical protein